MAKAKKRNRAAQDATLINVRTLRRAVAHLVVRVSRLEVRDARLASLAKRFARAVERLSALEILAANLEANVLRMKNAPRART